MKKILILTSLTIFSIGSISSLWCQGPNNNPITLIANAPPAVNTPSVQIVGNQGSATYVYWVVANYPVGSASPSGGGIVINAPSTLTGSNYVKVSWNTIPGVLSYDLLRTTSLTNIPSGNCNCAVATGLASTATPYSNTSNSLSSYTVNSVGSVKANITLLNRNHTTPRIDIDTPLNLPYIGYFGIGTTLNPLPVASKAYRIAIVNNGSTASDCTVGGGTSFVLCMDTGSVWTAIGGSGTGGGPYVPYTGAISDVNLGSHNLSTTGSATFGTTVLFPDGAYITATKGAGSDIGAQVTSLCTAHPNATVYIPSGSYSYSTTLDFSNCHVIGAGDSTVLNHTGVSALAKAYAWPALPKNSELEHVNFVAGGAEATHCVQVVDTENSKVHDITVSGCPSGQAAIAVIGDGTGTGNGQDIHGTLIYRNYVQQNTGDGIYVGGSGGSQRTVIRENFVGSNSGWCIRADYGVGPNSAINEVAELTVDSNTGFGCTLGALRLNGVQTVRVTGNTLGITGGNPVISLEGTAGGPDIQVAIDNNNLSCSGSNTYAIKTASSGTLLESSFFGNDQQGCTWEANVLNWTDVTADVYDISKIDVSSVANGGGSQVNSLRICDKTTFICAHYSNSNVNPSPTVTGVDTLHPGSQFSANYAGSFTTEATPTAMISGFDAGLTSGSFLANTLYKVYVAQVDSNGGVSPLTAPFGVTTSAGSNNRVITAFWTCTSLAATYQLYCATGVNNPTLCGTYSGACTPAGSTQHTNISTPTATPYPNQTNSFSSKWQGNGTSYTRSLFAVGVGAVLASGTTIAPTNNVHHVSGTSTVSSITIPAGFIGGCITLIPDGVWTTTTGGNIAVASVAIVGKVLQECLDGTSWYPSY